MPKIKTVKLNFNSIGLTDYSYSTFKGQLQYTLYYDAKDDFFYFDWKEINKDFENINYNQISQSRFGQCRTYRKALELLMFTIVEDKTLEKYIEIKITVNKTEKSNKDTDIISVGSNWKGINLEFKRIFLVRCGNLIGVQNCHKDTWIVESDPYFTNGKPKNLIPYTNETWDFLTNVDNNIKALGDLIYNFFDGDVELLEDKIKTSGQILLNK